MSQRIENIIDGPILPGTHTYTVQVPPLHSEIQVVIDRTRFENSSSRANKMLRVLLYAGEHGLGGASFTGGRVDKPRPGNRPGLRMLWSFFRTKLPAGVTEVELVVRADRAFNCLVHMDVFD